MASTQSTTQNMIPIQEVRDGIVILKDGGYRAVILVSALNLDLRSAEEQEATIAAFQSFLNVIDFDLQIVVESRYLDLRPYILSLEARVPEQESDLMRVQTENYIQFVRSLSERVDIMKKYFMLVVPYYPTASSSNRKGIFATLFGGTKSFALEDATFEEARAQLEQRVATVTGNLSGIGLAPKMLNTEEVIRLYVQLYNPGDSEGNIVSAVISQKI